MSGNNPRIVILVLSCLLIGCGRREQPEFNDVVNHGNDDVHQRNIEQQAEKEVEASQREVEALRSLGLLVFHGFSGRGPSVHVDSDAYLTEDGLLRPKVLSVLKEVRNLELHFLAVQKLSDNGVAQLKEIQGLQALSLCGKVTDAGLVHLKGMNSLKKLYLNYIAISDAGLAHLQDLTLVELGFAGLRESQEVTDVGLRKLHLEGLTRLHLGGTKITDATLALLANSSELSILWLSNCNVTDDGLAHLKRLKKISWLNLDGTNITSAGMAHLKRMPELFSLNLGGCKGITDDAVAEIGELRNLQSLNLYGTGITRAGAEIVKAKLPQCVIKGDGWNL